jgi:hypothetical protein
MSVNRLVTPSAQTVRLIAGRPVARASAWPFGERVKTAFQSIAYIVRAQRKGLAARRTVQIMGNRDLALEVFPLDDKTSLNWRPSGRLHQPFRRSAIIVASSIGS